ncbi:MAG: hypothetical protein QXO76_06605, partial [Thermoproteota archaeon]
VKQLQYDSRFMDDLGVKCCSEKVVAKVFKCSDGRSLLINLIDYRPEKNSFLMEIDADFYHFSGEVACRLYALDGQEASLDVKLMQGKLLVEIPPFNGKVASIVLKHLQ